jgi:hypothetical protein
MNKGTIGAIRALQDRCSRERRKNVGEVLEEALDDLVRNPNRDGDPDFLAGSAVARARTKLKRRAEIAPSVPLENVSEPATDDRGKHEVLMAKDAVERSGLTAKDRCYLRLVATGAGSREIAELEGVAVSLARVRVSRAHSRARRIWADAA